MRPRLRQTPALLAAVLLVAAWGLSSFAATNFSPWLYRAWQAEEGLPDISITGLAQTSDGYMWVGTTAGLLSFNGQEFSLVPPANLVGAPARPVRFLFRDQRDRLWLGMERGPLLRLSSGGLENVTARAGLPKVLVAAMAEDDQGAMFVVYANGQMFRVANEKAEPIVLPGPWQQFERALVARDHEGRIWCAVGPHAGSWQNGAWQPIATFESPVTAISAAQKNDVWAAAGVRICRLKADHSVTELGQLPVRSEVASILEDRTGALWVGTLADGLFWWNGEGFERVATSHTQITCLFEDAEGNIWAGTAGGGLNSIRPRVVKLVGRDAGLPFTSVISVAEDVRGWLWAAALNGQLACRRDGRWTLLDEAAGWPGGYATCVTADRKGGVWVGTADRGVRYFQDGAWQDWPELRAVGRGGVRSLLPASNGDLWVGALIDEARGHQIWRVRDRQVQAVTNQFRLGPIRALAESSDGTIWAGTAEGQILNVHDLTLISEPAIRKSGLLSVRSLLATPDGSLWIGFAGNGLGCLKDGRYTCLTTESGLADDFVSQLLADGRGNLWIAGNRGLSRVSFVNLESVLAGRAERVNPRRYGRADGVAGVQPNRDYCPSAWPGSDGQLWFSLRNGLLAVQPDKLGANPLPPAVQLERVKVDDQFVALYNAGSPLQTLAGSNLVDLHREGVVLPLAPGHRKVEIQFAGLSFASPENVQFRYRLSGFDADWVEAGQRRAAIYPRLPAGDHKFHVMACNNAGLWNHSGATLTLSVSPFFYETWWFKAGSGLATALAAGGIAYAISRARYRRRLRRSEARRALEQERTRIARDIHDELGTSVTRILMLSQPADDDPAASNPEMARIYDTASSLTRTMDEVVWAVNPRQDTLEGLTSYLTAFAQEFTSAANAACRLDLPERMPVVPLSAEVRHNLFLAAKEAIHNAVRHGRAQVITIALSIQPRALILTIRDDGIGFQAGAPAGPRHGHGMKNMRARLAAIGGECDITTQPQAGTTIRFTVPLARAGVL